MAEKTTIAQQIERIISGRNAIADHLKGEWKISGTEVSNLEAIRDTIYNIKYGPAEIKLTATSGGISIPAGYYDGSQKITITDSGGDGFLLIELNGDKAITPTDQLQTLLPGNYEDGADGFSSVVVNPIPKNYGNAAKLGQTHTPNAAEAGMILKGYEAIVYDPVEEKAVIVEGEIDSFTSADVKVIGDTVTIPAGYYATGGVKTIASGTVNQPSISVDENGLITAQTSYTSGYVTEGSTSKTLQLTPQAAITINPKREEITAVQANRYTTGAVKVSAIPNNLQDVTTLTNNLDKILKGLTFVGSDGKTVEGKMADYDDISTNILYRGRPEYVIQPGYYKAGTIKIEAQETTATITRNGGDIFPDPDQVLTKVTIPPVSTYLKDKVENMAPELVVAGSSYVDKNGDIQHGTMPKQEGDFTWDYEAYDKFPIPAGAYTGESTFVAEGYEYLNYDNMSSWEAISPYANADGVLKPEYEFVNNTFPPHVLDMKSVSLYKLPIVGNGNILTIGTYGVGYTMGADNSYESWDIAFNDGTVYVVYSNHTSPSYDFMAWVKDYTYGIPSAYVTMPDLVDALAAI